jgi:hypothetical protein
MIAMCGLTMRTTPWVKIHNSRYIADRKEMVQKVAFPRPSHNLGKPANALGAAMGDD